MVPSGTGLTLADDSLRSYVPRSSEVFSTSTLVGLTTSMYSLGLPVRSVRLITLAPSTALVCALISMGKIPC